MSRECRRVPANWEHPRDDKGQLTPLFGYNFTQRLAEWDEEAAKWDEGFCSDYHGGWEPKEEKMLGQSYVDWAGDRPKQADYMPEWKEDERTHYQMYETCSEGTPISPVMAAPEELARWLVDNRASSFGAMTASYEAWLNLMQSEESSIGMILEGGRMTDGVTAALRAAGGDNDS